MKKPINSCSSMILLTMLMLSTICLTGCGLSISKEKSDKQKNACETKNEKEKFEISSFILMNGVNGSINASFSLTKAEYENEIYYVFYKLLPDGGKQLMKIPASNSIVYNDEEYNPYVIIINKCVWIPVYSDGVKSNYSDYEIHIPKSSITEEYNGDLSNMK